MTNLTSVGITAGVPTSGTGTVSTIDNLINNYLVPLGQTTKSASVPVTIASDQPLLSYNYAHIAAGQATTVVKNSAGVLHTITFHGAATATNTTTVYDNASGAGTVIAIPVATAVTAPTTVTYDIAFANGLTIITATANGCDMTVSYL